MAICDCWYQLNIMKSDEAPFFEEVSFFYFWVEWDAFKARSEKNVALKKCVA